MSDLASILQMFSGAQAAPSPAASPFMKDQGQVPQGPRSYAQQAAPTQPAQAPQQPAAPALSSYEGAMIPKAYQDYVLRQILFGGKL